MHNVLLNDFIILLRKYDHIISLHCPWLIELVKQLYVHFRYGQRSGKSYKREHRTIGNKVCIHYAIYIIK